MKGRIKRWLMFEVAAKVVETNWFWWPLMPLVWWEYWYSMELLRYWVNPPKPHTHIHEQLSITGVRCQVGHVTDSDSNMDTWELMRYRAKRNV